MSTSSFWTRVRQARLFRVIAVYLGVCWVILQVASVLRDALSLPAWVSPVAVLLLLIGLAIIVMTAWVQSHPATAQKAEADQVPGRWELDVAEIKRSLAKGEVPHPTWARAILGGVFAFSLLFGVAGVYVVIKDRGQSFVPEPALAAAAPGIAVLPFDVKGEGLDVWREGMVDLLATNLDGVAGLRAIDSRTVLASWRDHVPGTGMPALRQSLEVADGIGARYALVGSAVAIGGGVRLAADVYDVASGSKLGLAHVEGSPDSVLALVDRFSVEIVRAILQQRGGEVPPIHGLATLTTASLPALKAYLEGEALYRRSSFERATAAYERAAAADTGFALAYMRLAAAVGWTEGLTQVAAQYVEKAYRRIERLPPRDAAIVQADYAFHHGRLDAVDALRRAVQRYPDDPDAWFLLGDTYWHLGDQALIGIEEAVAALERAIALDPSFAPYYIHPIEYAINEGDSARARHGLDTYARLAGGSTWERRMRLAYALVLGDSTARSHAVEALDTVPSDVLAGGSLYQLRTLHAFAALAAERRTRPDADARTLWRLAQALGGQGKIASALDLLRNDPMVNDAFRAVQLYALHLSGAAVPEALLDEWLRLPAADSTEIDVILAAGAAAAERGRWGEHARAVQAARAVAERSRVAGDTAAAQAASAIVRALEGYARWQRGDAAAALDILETAQREAVGLGPLFEANKMLRRWLAELHERLGSPRDALRYYESLVYPASPYATLRAAIVHEALGEADKARERYASALAAWQDADPDYAPARQARAALERLGSDRPRP